LPTENGNKFVFIGTQGGAGLSNMSMTAVLKRMGRGDITVHGFRSTFMDWCHERTSYPKVVIDKALAHTVSDKVEAAYQRSDLFDKRRRLMADWAKFCATKSIERGTVISLTQLSLLGP
jgi:integrase